ASPSTIAGWITCGGFSGVLAYSRDAPPSVTDSGIMVRAVAFPDSTRPTYSVVVDLPVGMEVREQLRRDTGVSITSLVVTRDADRNVTSQSGRGASPAARAPAAASGDGWLSNIPSL